MAFMMKKKRYKFSVECCLEKLTEVPFLSGVLFAKVRLLDGGNFQDLSPREEVKNHAVQWNAVFSFVVKMCANANTGVLEPALMRISVRKECKGGRSYQKLGFCNVNLAELAGSHESTRRCLLESYRRRPDNSVLRLTIKMNMISGDPLFKVPGAEGEDGQQSAAAGAAGGGAGAAGAEDDDTATSTPTSGIGSLTHRHKHDVAPALVSEMSSPEPDPAELIGPPVSGACASCIQQPPPHTHSRNSSNTSGDMSSKASSYGSSVSAHSRHSSDGDSADLPRHHHNSAAWSPASEEYVTPDGSLRSPADGSFCMPSYFDVKRRSAAALLAASVAPLGGFALLKQKSLSTLPARRHQPPDHFSNFPFLTPLATRKSSLAPARLSGCLEDSPAPAAPAPAAAAPPPRRRVEAGRARDASCPRRAAPPASLAPLSAQPPASLAPPAARPPLPALQNLSSGSLTASASESGSLERARREPRDRRRHDDDVVVSCRVENTRVNPGSLIEELLAGAGAGAGGAWAAGAGEGAGLQLYIARDGTAELGPRHARAGTCVQLTPNDSR